MANANSSNMKKNYVIFAGGHDGEMAEITRVCREVGIEVVDHNLPWGAKVSDYAEDIAKVVADGKIPVLVELTPDAEMPANAIVVDHHNENAGKPASLLQVLDLLGIEPSRRQQLIAANDSGYIPAMLALGATPEEIAEVRYADRAAQGITPAQEREAERAIAAAEVVNSVTIIRMSHSKSSPVCDRLFNPEKEERLLILSNGKDGSEVNFFGNGELCQQLRNKFRGWMGGNLPQNGFWGCENVEQDSVLDYVTKFFAE